ncbi:hypothetical protein Hanom_Chr17g01585031 [Helianthus anomalus]
MRHLWQRQITTTTAIRCRIITSSSTLTARLEIGEHNTVLRLPYVDMDLRHHHPVIGGLPCEVSNLMGIERNPGSLWQNSGMSQHIETCNKGPDLERCDIKNNDNNQTEN